MISVCLATYNGEKHIKEQLASILSQLKEEDEIIVSDAGSTDNTLAAIALINDKRIRIFHYKETLEGTSVFDKMDRIRNNFEHALKQAQGDIIFLSDQDDIWFPNKTARVTEQLKTAECVIHDCCVINANGKVIIPSFLNFFKPSETLVGLFFRSPFMGCCMAIKRSVLDFALPFPNTHIEHDTCLGICAYKIGRVKILKEPLIYYRRHGKNASLCTSENTNSIKIKILRRLYMLQTYFKY